MVVLVLIKPLMTITVFKSELIILLIITSLWSNGMIVIRKKNIIGDSMLNNINSCGLSKSNKVSVSNFPGATSEDILDEIEDTLKTHPDTLIVHTGTNDLTKNINTLRSVKKLCEKAKRISPDTKIAFLNTIYRKDRRNTDKQRVDIDARLKNLFYQKNIPLIDNGNIKEEHVGVKTLHLNRRDNSLFAKNLLGFTEQNLKLFM